ncbi:hypothetical protein I4U23_004282 [Adineta vaga]|nr:hypothetical protein I4U23_004282 [Adineta vaga]
MEFQQIICILNIIILLNGTILMLIYLLSIILIRRFHTATNILTGNFCLTGIVCGSYWIVYDVLSSFYSNIIFRSIISCIVTSYLPIMVNCLMIHALAMITFNRFFTVTYPNKKRFKEQTWSFMSIIVQWIVAIILPLPHLILSFQACQNGNRSPSWISLYNIGIILILPSITMIFFNSMIFYSVHSSTRRVQTLPSSTSAISSVNHGRARDIYLVKHMLFMFVVFIAGWGPIYMYSAIVGIQDINSSIIITLQILPVSSSFINIVDLFMYNHDLRRYLTERLLKYLHLNRN